MIKQIFLNTKSSARKRDDAKVFRLIWSCDKFKQIRNDVSVNFKIRYNFKLSLENKFTITIPWITTNRKNGWMKTQIRFQFTGCRLQVEGYRLQVAGWRLQVAGYKLQLTRCRLPVTGSSIDQYIELIFACPKSLK